MIPDNTSIRRGTYSDSWITPPHVLDIVRGIHGQFTHDLASSQEANEIVRVLVGYWSAEHPCPLNPGLGSGDNAWCNPPGPGSRVKEFWAIWCAAIQAGATGGFLIFKQDHWRQLPCPPIPVTVIVLRKRLAFRAPEIEYLRACERARKKGRPIPSRRAGANFPSTLILSGDFATEPALRGMLAQHGHVMLWEPTWVE